MEPDSLPNPFPGDGSESEGPLRKKPFLGDDDQQKERYDAWLNAAQRPIGSSPPTDAELELNEPPNYTDPPLPPRK